MERDYALAPRSHVGVDGSVLVIAWPNMPTIALDTCLLDRITVSGSNLLLCLDDLEVSMYIADGAHVATQIAAELTPYTREVPIRPPEVYEDARRRLRSRNDARARKPTDFRVTVAGEPLTLEGEMIVIGASRFTMAEILTESRTGGHLALVGGGWLQAAMALIIVAAEERRGGREDLAHLEQRVAARDALLVC